MQSTLKREQRSNHYFQRISLAWEHLTFWQRTDIYVHAIWWAFLIATRKSLSDWVRRSLERKGNRVKHFQVFMLVIALILLRACDASATVKTADHYVNEYGGNVQVYERILALDDCSALQEEFDQADENTQLQEPGTPQYRWSIGYMEASNDRMEEIGCFQ
jgi:hypothetical protein